MALKLQEEWVQVNLKSHLPQFLGILNSLQPGLWEFLIGRGVIKHQLHDNIDVSSIGTISQGNERFMWKLKLSNLQTVLNTSS